MGTIHSVAYLLVISGADFLQEIWHSLALWQRKALALKEFEGAFAGPMVHHASCRQTMIICEQC